MSSIGNRIKNIHNSYRENIISILKDIPVSNIGDVTNRLQGIDPDIRRINDCNICGRAVTVKVPAGDNLFIHKALDDFCDEGDILVINEIGHHGIALLGELMITFAKSKGVRGIVTNGYVRDYEFIKNLDDFGVYAMGATLNGPFKNGPGEIGTAIALGGQVVHSGDYICGDRDGVIVIPQEDVETIIKEALEIKEKEEVTKKKIEQGTYEKPWVNEKIDKLNTEVE